MPRGPSPWCIIFLKSKENNEENDHQFAQDCLYCICGIPNYWLLLVGLRGTNFSEIRIGILRFPLKKCILDSRLPKWRPFCWGEGELSSLSRCDAFVLLRVTAGHQFVVADWCFPRHLLPSSPVSHKCLFVPSCYHIKQHTLLANQFILRPPQPAFREINHLNISQILANLVIFTLRKTL